MPKPVTQPYSSLDKARAVVASIQKEISVNAENRKAILKQLGELAKQAGTNGENDAALGEQYRKTNTKMAELTEERRRLGVELRRAERCCLHFLGNSSPAPLLNGNDEE